MTSEKTSKQSTRENATERPTKVILGEVVSKPDTQFVPKDPIAIRQAMYRERRKQFHLPAVIEFTSIWLREEIESSNLFGKIMQPKNQF